MANKQQKQEKILTGRISDNSATNNTYLAWLPFEFVQKNAVGSSMLNCKLRRTNRLKPRSLKTTRTQRFVVHIRRL